MHYTLGFFFDGTGNNKRSKPQTTSNVAKLYRAYGNESDDEIGKLYVRGVGSRKYAADKDPFGGETLISEGIDRLLGGAFGLGGHQRVNYMLKRAREIIDSRPEITSLTVDLFGFSRGAALARHFVRLIHNAPLHQCQTIRFLGLFDTVGSFGIPGNNKDNFVFGVSNEHARYIYHLVAENELRKNFDLWSIRASETGVRYF